VNPVLLVIAGPNGAGKTTVTARLRVGRFRARVATESGWQRPAPPQPGVRAS